MQLLNEHSERWRYALEKRNEVSKFVNEREACGKVNMEWVELVKVDEFKYLG